MLRTTITANLIAVVLSGMAHATSCNEKGRLDDYLYEWLSSSAATRAAVREQFLKWHQEDVGREAVVQGYTRHFAQRAAPLGELKYCTSVQLFERVGHALSRFK